MKEKSKVEMMYDCLKQIEKNVPQSEKFSQQELVQLEKLSESKNEEIRMQVAQILASFTEERDERILLKLVHDRCSLVRVEACDSLKYSNNLGTYKVLLEVSKRDGNGMVRGYAINSLGEMSKKLNNKDETIEWVKKLLLKEKVIFTLINIYKVLYELGEHQYLQELLECLDSKVYQNRCAAANSLKEIYNLKNENVIKKKVMARLQIEKSRAVKTTLEKMLM